MNKNPILCCLIAGATILANSCSNHAAHKEEAASKEVTVNEPAENSATATTSYAYSTAVSEKKQVSESKADTVAPPSLSSVAALARDKDGMKFVRTADLRFQVKDVTDATYHIEDIASQFGGFVTYTNLHSTVSNTETVPVSADSSLYITYYTMENDMTFRVPNKRLDSALRAMSGLVDFLDHRLIVATEVSSQALANELAEKRNHDYEQRMMRHADNKPAKQEDATTAEDKALQGREAADNARLANMSLEDQVKYSTVHLIIYQKESSRKTKVNNDTDIARYKPPFITQVGEALMSGWLIFESIIVGLAHLWVFLLLLGLGLIAYFRFRKK